MAEPMLGSPGEDLGLVIDFATKLRHGGNDFREAAKKFLRKTLITLRHGDGTTKAALLAAYGWVGEGARALRESGKFRTASARGAGGLGFVDGNYFDHAPSSDEVLAELAKRGLEEPPEEDALRYGATC